MTGYQGMLYGLAARKNVLVSEPVFESAPVVLTTQPGYWFPGEAATRLFYDSHEDAYNALEDLAVEARPDTYKERV